MRVLVPDSRDHHHAAYCSRAAVLEYGAEGYIGLIRPLVKEGSKVSSLGVMARFGLASNVSLPKLTYPVVRHVQLAVACSFCNARRKRETAKVQEEMSSKKHVRGAGHVGLAYEGQLPADKIAYPKVAIYDI